MRSTSRARSRDAPPLSAARLRALTRLQPLLPRAAGPDPAGDALPAQRRAELGAVLGRGRLAEGAGGLPAHVRRVGGRDAAERRVRLDRGLGTGALPLPWPRALRRDRRPAVRAADRGWRDRADGALLGQRLGRAAGR